MRNAVTIFLISVVLYACAEGSIMVTGEQRPQIDPALVTVVHRTDQMPEGCESVALLDASSEMGWTKQASVNYAIEQMKKDAAKVGANLILIGHKGESTNVVAVGDKVYAGTQQELAGEAYYCD